jgi:germination protein M
LTQARVNVLTAVGLVGLLVLVASTGPFWTRILRKPFGREDTTPAAAQSGARGAEAQRTINVKLFFEAADRPGLQTEERAVAFSSDLADQLQTVVEELVKGSRSGLAAPLPAATRVLDVFVSKQGVAYVDLSKDAAVAQGGSQEELMAVYAVVNTLTANFPAVKGVQLMLDDAPAFTLGGHVDITRPLRPDMTLLAGGGSVPGDTPPATTPPATTPVAPASHPPTPPSARPSPRP